MFDTFTKKCTRNYTAAYTNRLKAISETLIIIVISYNLILIAISLRLIKLSINRPGCGLKENYDFRVINALLSKIPFNFFFNYLLFSECLPNSHVDLSNSQ